MTRHFQHIVSESRLVLPFTAAWGILVWLAYGLADDGLWAQFACFSASAWLMYVLDNAYAFIRVYSRMVYVAYIWFSCAACFLFSSLGGAVVGLCAVASYCALFRCYQDRRSPGFSFYAFALLGIASLFRVHVLFFVPLLWLLMAFCIRCLGWRTLFASLFGLCVPYWFVCSYVVWTGDWPLLAAHFAQLVQTGQPFDFALLPPGHWAAFGLLLAAGLVGMTHYYRQSHDDKIRTRMFYNFFVALWAASALLVVACPHLSDLGLRLMAINVSPLMAHFTALSRMRLAKVVFVAFAVSTLLITVFNLTYGSLL